MKKKRFYKTLRINFTNKYEEVQKINELNGRRGGEEQTIINVYGLTNSEMENMSRWLK